MIDGIGLDGCRCLPDTRSQSETIGITLLTGVVVVLTVIVGVVVLGGQASGDTPVAEFDVELSGQHVTVKHVTGDTIPKDELAVAVQSGSSSQTRLTGFTELDGNGDGYVDPGERFRDEHSVGKQTVRVLIAHRPTNTVLYNRVLNVPLTALTANFGWSPKPAKTGETITFDGSTSTSTSPITSYEWDLDGDRRYEKTGTTVTNSYADNGTYDVRLTVTNGTGATDTITKPVFVDNRLPVPQFSVTPSPPSTADIVTFNASASSDSDGTITSYEWDLNDDGTFETSGEQISTPVSPDGAYNITLRVTDDDGETNTTATTVTVERAGVVTAVEPDPAVLADDQGEFVAIELPTAVNTTDWVLADDETGSGNANTTLPSGTQQGRLYFTQNVTKFNRTWAVDGDIYQLGSGSEEVLADSDDVVRLVNTSNDVVIDAMAYRNSSSSGDATTRSGWWFEYGAVGDVINRSQSGTSFVDTDSNGDWAQTRESEYLNDRPDVALTVRPGFPNPGETVVFNASNSTDSDGIASYEWSFGDGTTTTTTGDAVINHTYSTRGNYTANLTVVDTAGAKNATSVNLTVGRSPDNPQYRSSGLVSEYYEADSEYTSLPDFETEVPDRLNRTDDFTISPVREDEFAFRFTGHVRVPRNGTYRFYTASDDGSKLFIGGEEIVDNSGLHATTEESGVITLEAGRHNITVTYFEHEGGENLAVRWKGPGISKEPIPTANLTTGPAALYSVQCTNRQCEFNASASVAGGRGIDTYEWDFGDGTTTTTSDQTVTHTYGSLGEYTTELTISESSDQLDTSERRANVTETRLSDDPGSLTSGIEYEYYEQRYTSLPDYDSTDPTTVGTTDAIDLSVAERQTEYALRFQGYIDVPETGTYTFETRSDDGSRLYIGDQLLVDNGGSHANKTVTGDEIKLQEGNHSITVTYFDQGGETGLEARWSGPDFTMTEISASNLFRQTPAWDTEDDWDTARSESGVVHEDFGDRTAGAVELGYPSTDRGGSELVGYWPLDEDSGTTAVDVSDSGYNGTRTDGAISQTGTFGTTSYDFQDSGWVGIDGFPNFQSSFTLSAWIQTRDKSERGQRIFIDDETNSGGYGFSLGDGGPGRLRFYSRAQSSASLNTGNVIENGRWYHVVAVMNTNSNTVRIYINGTQRASDSFTGSLGTDSGVASIGGETANGETENRFDGNIDDVRVYERALSGTEIQQLFDTGSAGSQTTDRRLLETAVDPSTLSLQNVQATRPSGTDITITVESDPDADGTFEETSDTITLDGRSSYAVSGLSSNSRTFRLSVSYSTTDPTTSPSLDRVELST